MEISKVAYRYAFALYAFIAGYVGYCVYSLWLFLGKHYFPQDVSSILSVQNGQFYFLHWGVTLLGVIATVSTLILNSSMRHFLVDVGDELSRVSWTDFRTTQKSTIVVILLVIASSIVIFVADSIFLKIVQLFMSTAA